MITPSGTEPTLDGHPIIDIVRLAYEQGLAAGDAMGDPPIGREKLEAAVNYCADRACDRDRVHCRGCRLRTEGLGVSSLDAFCRQHAAVRFTDTGLVIEGGGKEPEAVYPSLDQLARSWQGEEVFYLARRVHRRLHKERDPRWKRMPAIEGEPAPVVILVAPQMADNIGMAARAMANFGLEEMRLVNPRDGWPNARARHAASGALYVLDTATAHRTTADAIGDLNWVCATTARQRFLAKPVMTPGQAAAEMGRRIALGQRVGVMFGPERQGLENDDVALADAVVMAPVNPRFASLNLAQAVLLMGYEWMKESAKGTLGRVTTYETPRVPGPVSKGSAPATKEQLMGFFGHLEKELDEAGFLKPESRAPVMVRNIRTMFERMEASEQEVRTLRGIVAALTGTHKRRKGGP
jgi:tRNA/rRNA methyltransferase